MNRVNQMMRLAMILLLTAGAIPSIALAEDIDIFTGASGGASAAPNVMFLLENTANWSNNAQKFPPATSGSAACLTVSTQGDAEKCAITNTLLKLGTGSSTNVGLAMFNGTSGYVRYGARDMTNTTNNNALQNLVNGISINSPSEKINQKGQDESAAFYEMYLYFQGSNPYAGSYAANPLVDVSGNTGLTATGQGATCLNIPGQNCGLSGSVALGSGLYNSPTSTCSKGFVVFILNNNDAQALNNGSSSYGGGPNVSSLAPPGTTSWAPYWAQYLYNSGITVYVIDVYNAHSNPSYTAAAQLIAKKGGGKYFHAQTTDDLTSQLSQILNEIQAVNSTFASASLPVNATNRSQDQNQVFIPMFRPDAAANPLWKGNLKLYQLINVGGAIELGDNSSPSAQAINPLTGFPTDCAKSFWSSDSGAYWQTVSDSPSPFGKCANTTASPWSDLPDGPFVEKGGVAEVIRNGNNPPSTTSTPTNVVNRTIYTGSPLAAFNSSSAGLATATGLSSLTTPTLDTVVNFIQGQDTNSEYPGRSTSLTRPSLHGDTVHSRPLPVDYGNNKVVVYYGSNDGTYRAVDASTTPSSNPLLPPAPAPSAGRELWSYIAPEHFYKLQRLEDNAPMVKYPNSVSLTATPKDYFFDGSTGIYQDASTTSPTVWIYPSMRRGGRMLYAFNVSNPAGPPALLWKVGCPNKNLSGNVPNDTGCTASMSGIGQTWSTPQVAGKIAGYSKPVVIVGGGYDNCEDNNYTSPCALTPAPKGAAIYVLDAFDGTLLKTFTFPNMRSVAADVALISVTTPGVVDHAYAVDLGGKIYRMDFGSGGPASWVINKVAGTNVSNGVERKFFYPPALLSVGTKVYLALGSGDREHPLATQYPYTTPVTNRFYVYADDLTATAFNDLDGSIFTNATVDGGCTASTLFASSKKGYYIDLTQNGRGEQTVTSALIVAGLVAFSTNRPVLPAAGTCSTNLGEARGYFTNLFTGSGAVGTPNSCGGTRSGIFVGGGLPPSPIFGIVPVNGVSTPVIIGAVQRQGGANSPIAPQKVAPIINPKRKIIYWKSSNQN